jgi:hypothetical protein
MGKRRRSDSNLICFAPFQEELEPRGETYSKNGIGRGRGRGRGRGKGEEEEEEETAHAFREVEGMRTLFSKVSFQQAPLPKRMEK